MTTLEPTAAFPAAITPVGPKGDSFFPLSVDGLPAPTVGVDGQVAIDWATGRIYEKKLGKWREGPKLDIQALDATEEGRAFLKAAGKAGQRAWLGVDNSERLTNFRNAEDGRSLDGAIYRMWQERPNQTRVEVWNDGDEYTISAPIELPDTSQIEGGSFTDEHEKFRLWSGNGAKIRLTAAGKPYVAGYKGFRQGALVNQNTGLVLEGLELWGPGARSGTVGVGLANTSYSTIRDCVIAGCDSMVEFYGDDTGGCMRNTVDNVRSRLVPWHKPGYSMAEVLAMANRNGVRANGNRRGQGKVQDTTILRSCFNHVLIGAISTRGHGDALDSASDASGGCVNLQEWGNRIYSDAGTELVTTTIDHVDNNHTIYLTPGAQWIDIGNGMFVDCVLRIKDAAGVYYYAWIDDFTAASLKVVTSTDFPFAPTGGLSASICYGDAQARTEFDAHELQHYIYWESRDFEMHSSGVYTELMRPLVAAQKSNEDVYFTHPSFTIKRSRGCIRHKDAPTDSDVWSPSSAISGHLIGYPGHEGNIFGQVWMPGKPGLSNYGEHAVALPAVNMMGIDGLHGGCAALRGSDYNLGASANYTASGGVTPHVPIWAPDLLAKPNGSRLSWNKSGRQKALLDGVGATGDLLLSKSGGVWQAVSKVGVSGETVAKAKGELVTGKSTTGVGYVMADFW